MRFVTVVLHPSFPALVVGCLMALAVDSAILAQPCCGQDRGQELTRSVAQSGMPEVLPREAAELEIALGRIRLVPDRFRIVRKHEQFEWPAKPAGAPVVPNCTRSMQVAAQDGRPR